MLKPVYLYLCLCICICILYFVFVSFCETLFKCRLAGCLKEVFIMLRPVPARRLIWTCSTRNLARAPINHVNKSYQPPSGKTNKPINEESQQTNLRKQTSVNKSPCGNIKDISIGNVNNLIKTYAVYGE